MQENCQVCSSNGTIKANYKCPKCYIKYCGLQCWKEHQKAKCSKPVTDKTSSTALDYDVSPLPFLPPTDDTVPQETLEKLKESGKLKTLLQNPHLRRMIEEVDKAKVIKNAIQQAMMEDIFVEFADACLEVVEPQED